MHVHSVELDLALRPWPPRHQHRHVVARSRDAAEDLVQVFLRAARLGIQPVLPVEDEDVQAAPPVSSPSMARMRASNTPFTNRGLSAVPYFSASLTPS
jgi:hypothetical protein